MQRRRSTVEWLAAKLARVLFAVIFSWTPPRFRALAMKFGDEWAAAKVPVLPVVAGPAW